MKMKINLMIIAAAAIFAAACGNSANQNGEPQKVDQEVKPAEPFQALPFPDVQIPAMLSDQQDMLNYLAENYWDGFTDTSRNYPCDSLYVSGVVREIVEQKFADWTLILDYVDISVARKAVGKLYDRAYACEKHNSESNVFETLCDLAPKYFYDPNSPMRNEDYYLPFVSKYASYEGLSEVEKGKYERETRMCSLNKVGTKAADFRFSDKNGRMRNLYDIKAPYILLFFSNPGCEACMQIINVLKGEPAISKMIADKTLAVLNIYIDEDIQAWRSYMPVYPEEWYNGFDPDFVLRSNEIYAVRAIPSLYLLDHEKRVILKDVPENKLFNFLARI